jgi:SAM-dependent methyltransferase
MLTAMIKRWGPKAAKQRVWNSEYEKGKWQYQRQGPNNEDVEPVYEFVERYATDGTVLDLGCGSGMTALEMRNTFRSYVGVDVSDVAISNARAVLENGVNRATKVRFFAADISSYVTDENFSVILFRESIYYVPMHMIKSMLDRYARNLILGGAFIVRICDRERFKGIIQLIESNFRLEETFTPQDSSMTILVFRPCGSKSAEANRSVRS